MSKMVWVATNHLSQVVRIFRSKKAAFDSGISLITRMDRSWAVTHIRRQIFVRSGGDCELCGVNISETMGHMHEKQHRGKGGEISLANSIFICPTCHRQAHVDRNPHWSKKPLTVNDDSGSMKPDEIPRDSGS